MGGAEADAHQQNADAGDGRAQHHHAEAAHDHLHIGERRHQHFFHEFDEAGEIDRRWRIAGKRRVMMFIIRTPGNTNSRYLWPPIWEMRPPTTEPKMKMNSSAEIQGATKA